MHPGTISQTSSGGQEIRMKDSTMNWLIQRTIFSCGIPRRVAMMKHKFLMILIGTSLLFTACTSAGNPATATPEAIPTVKADTAIIAEGRLEPVRYAEIAFSASGV